MKLLIKNIRVIDPGSSHNGKETDLLIIDGKIDSIKKGIVAKGVDIVHEGKGQCVSTGWFELHSRFCDPGFEYKEDLDSGLNAAMAGGFTGTAVMPSTNPTVHTKSLIEYIINKTKGKLVDVHPVGAISRNMEGKEMAEMYDMFSSGAIAFSDDKNSVGDSGLLLRALLYTKNFKGLIMNFPNDKSIAGKGVMNEGISSTKLGMTGIPAMAEEIIVARDLKLTEYADSRIHFSTISTAGSVQLIREAKKKGLKVTADVAAHQLAFDDNSLEGFDSNFKVMPPLRGKKDQLAIIDGLADGTIDAICADHTPEDIENKKKEFDYAAFGVIALETCFASMNSFSGKKLPLEKIIERLTTGPRKILGLEVPVIKEKMKANLTLFDTERSWTVTENDFRSKSKNSPFIGMKLKGRTVAVFNNGQWKMC